MSAVETLLAEFAAREQGRPFVWGETNCVALALRWLDTVSGGSLHRRHCAQMSSAPRAAAWTRRHGARGLVDQMRAAGLTELLPAFARPGDVLIGSSEDDQIAAHIVLGRRLLSATAAQGVLQLPSEAAAALSWAVGWRTY